MIKKIVRKRDNLKTIISNVDDDIFKKISRIGVSNAKSSSGKKYNYVICFEYGRNGRQFLLHREVAQRMIGRDLCRSDIVDHIDGNPLNNTRTNIRICSQSENLFNSKKRIGSKSVIKGVSFCNTRKKWRSCITAYGKTYQKRFSNKSDAIKFSKKLRKKLHKHFYNYG